MINVQSTKENTKYFITLTLFVLGISYYYYFAIQKDKSPQIEQANTISVQVPFNGSNQDEENISGKKTYTDNSNNTLTISESREVSSRNPTYNVLVNGTNAGQIAGISFSQAGFSPDSKYFAIRGRSVLGCGGACQSTNLYVVDLTQPKVMLLLTKPKSTVSNSGDFNNQYSFVESYTWTGGAIFATNFVVGFDENTGSSFRLGPREVWNFDLSEPESIMRNGHVFNILPE